MQPNTVIRAVLFALTLATAFPASTLAACQIQSIPPAPLKYAANEEARGTLSFNVVCANQTDRYSLAVSAPGGSFDTASGAYVLAAPGNAGSRLNILLQNAYDSLGGQLLPQVYQGTQSFSYPLLIPVGQWMVTGLPSLDLSIALSDVSH